MLINENIDFSSYDSFTKDFEAIKTLIIEYINDRKECFQTIISGICDKDSINIYNRFFIQCESEYDEDCWEGLWRIFHFLDRNYEIFNQEDITYTKQFLLQSLNECNTNVDTFIDDETDTLSLLIDNFNEFCKACENVKLLNIDKMDNFIIHDINVYSSKNTDENVLELFNSILDNFMNTFRKDIMHKLDTICLVDSDYIEYIGGEGTIAFYTDQCLFLSNKLDTLDKDEVKFYKTVVCHELGHFLYSNLSEVMQIYWYDLAKTWIENNTKLTRDDETNSQTGIEMYEELFADCVACYFNSKIMTDKDYIHNPNPIIMTTFKNIIGKELI